MGLVLALGAPAQAAEAPAGLPEPLTLAFALSLADERHPDLEAAEARLASAQAERARADAAGGLTASVVGTAAWVEANSRSSEPGPDDHSARLVLRKRLYDFGRTRAAVDAAEADVLSDEWHVLGARQQRRIQIADRFFDVLLADLRFARDDEAMAIAFVTMDRLRQRNALGQVSDVALRESESDFQRARRARTASQAAQRATRARLAAALNRPDSLPSRLVEPALPGNARARPELEALEAAALARNPGLKGLRAALEAADLRIESARAGRNPLLVGEVEAGAFTRKLSGRDLVRAGVTLEVPLSTGGAVEAEVARSEAERAALRARYAQAEIEVRQSLLEAWLELDTLAARREEARALADYRDLYLDRSRALYEQEVRADLGDAMVQSSAARLASAEAEYALALTWARIDALTGAAPEEIVAHMLEAGTAGGEPR